MSKLLTYGLTGFALLAILGAPACGRAKEPEPPSAAERSSEPPPTGDAVTIFLSGDVMTGRGIDQILPHPGDPQLYESYVRDARRYVALAEEAHGPIDWPVDDAYIWGDALQELARVDPDVRAINLETSITTSGDYWPGKEIHYRMHPQNVPALTAAGIDCCVLANNHVLDWGYAGLAETLDTLAQAGIQRAGAGRDRQEAEAPAVIEVGEGTRVLLYAYGLPSSGIPGAWAAAADRGGVNLLEDLSDDAVRRVRQGIEAVRREGDIVVVSIHWGGNWGYPIPSEQRTFAHRLIDEAGADIVHGHSSHHAKGIEVYQDRLVLYGCGDLLTDYEGIGGYEAYRGDLGLMYFARVDPGTGALLGLHMAPMQSQRLRLTRPARADARWLRDTLNREGRALGTWVELDEDGTLDLRWLSHYKPALPPMADHTHPGLVLC